MEWGDAEMDDNESYKTRRAYENDDDTVQIHGGWVYAITDVKKLAMLRVQF
jgi:hypothetical protein